MGFKFALSKQARNMMLLVAVSFVLLAVAFIATYSSILDGIKERSPEPVLSAMFGGLLVTSGWSCVALILLFRAVVDSRLGSTLRMELVYTAFHFFGVAFVIVLGMMAATAYACLNQPSFPSEQYYSYCLPLCSILVGHFVIFVGFAVGIKKRMKLSAQ